MANFKGKIEIYGWEDVKKRALDTIHKKWVGKEITSEWKENILLSRHSPIRELKITIVYDEIPRWIADQLVRHSVGVNNYMGTMRTDRGNKPRAEQRMVDTTNLTQVYNGESFLKMISARMCIGCVSGETREYVESIVSAVKEIEPELGLFCNPPCISQWGCKEIGFGGCNHLESFQTFISGVVALNKEIRYPLITDLKERYKWYQDYREDI